MMQFNAYTMAFRVEIDGTSAILYSSCGVVIDSLKFDIDSESIKCLRSSRDVFTVDVTVSENGGVVLHNPVIDESKAGNLLRSTIEAKNRVKIKSCATIDKLISDLGAARAAIMNDCFLRQIGAILDVKYVDEAAQEAPWARCTHVVYSTGFELGSDGTISHDDVISGLIELYEECGLMK